MLKLNVSVDQWFRTLATIRNECDAQSKRHPNDRIEVYAAAEPCPLPKERGRIVDIIHSSVVACGTEREDLEGYWILVRDCGFAIRYLGDRQGRDAFVGLSDEFQAVISANADWSPARPIGMAGFLTYLGLWRPMPLLRTAFIPLNLSPGPVAENALLEKHGGVLKTIQLCPSQGAFLAATAAIDWIVAPTAVMRLPTAVKYPTKLLPEWEGVTDCFREIEAQASGAQPAKIAPANPSGDLVIGDFFLEYRGRRCDLGNVMPYKLLRFLYLHVNRYVAAVDVGDGAWGDDGAEPKTIKKTARNTNRLLKAANVEGVAIDTSQREYLRLVVT